MRSSLGKTLAGVSAVAIVSLAITVAGISTTSAEPVTPPQHITITPRAVSYVTETTFADIGWRPVITTLHPTYVVTAGDTLTGISLRECGVGTDWPSLFVKNEAVIGANFNSLRIGETLAIACDPSVAPPALPSLPPPPTPAVVNTAQVTVTHHSAPRVSSARVSTSGDGSFQACVIKRESGGNPQVMNGSGHYGLYQFSASTWRAYGGNPADFGHASAAEQNQVFANAMARGGEGNWAPYDGC